HATPARATGQGPEALGESAGAAGVGTGRAPHQPGVSPDRTATASTRARNLHRRGRLRDRLVIVVLDTNVFVAARVAKGLCHEVVVRGLGSCTVATSQPLIDELEHTLRAKFTLGPAGRAFLEQLRLRVRIVEPTPRSSPVSRDA